MRAVSNKLSRVYKCRSELIMQSLPRLCEPNRFEKIYKNDAYNSSNTTEKNHELFVFPVKEFKCFSKSSIYELLKYSHDVLKSKGLMGINEYNNLIKSYIIHDIEVEMVSLLNDMKNINLQPDYDTYRLIIMMYCRNGNMNAVQSLLNVLKSKQDISDEMLNESIYGGFIKSGEFDKADEYLKEKNIDVNNLGILKVKALSYTDLKKFSEAIEILEKIKTMDEYYAEDFVKRLYPRFVISGASKLELDQVFKIGNIANNYMSLYNIIINLNRSGYYNSSLDLILNYENQLYSLFQSTEIVESFNKSDCPLNIYMSVIDHFKFRLYSSYSHLFLNVLFDSALSISENIINEDNCRCIFSSLIKKAFQGKCINDIELTLQFGIARLEMNLFNVVMEYVFIPSLFESDIVPEPIEIVELLPRFKHHILQAIHMYYLCRADFSTFNALLEKYPTRRQKYINNSKRVPDNLLSHLSINQLDEFDREASKVFDRKTMDILIRNIIARNICKSSEVNDVTGISDSINMAQKLGISFSMNTISFLKQETKYYNELLDQLQIYDAISDGIPPSEEYKEEIDTK